jgi:hypothetical protein
MLSAVGITCLQRMVPTTQPSTGTNRIVKIHESSPNDEAVSVKRQRVGREAALSPYRDHVRHLQVGGHAAVGVVVELHHLVDVCAV